MTTPTQAQIEAAGTAYWNFYRQLDGNKPEAAFTLDGDFAGAITAALTAAAQVGEPKRLIPRSEVLSDKQLIAAVIERCAQVAERYDERDGILASVIAAAIRKLRDEP